jgi:hypothetical protein
VTTAQSARAIEAGATFMRQLMAAFEAPGAGVANHEPTGYGIGFEVACDPSGGCFARQIGAVVGGAAFLLIDRTNRIVAAVVMNVGTATAAVEPQPAQPPPDPNDLLAAFGR